MGDLAIYTVLTCGLERSTPRTCTAENAIVATNGDNLDAQVTLVADLSINPVSKQVDFSHSIPIESDLANTAQVRENMQQLLDIILGFFEVETQMVESGVLKEEDMLFDHYVQEVDTDSKHTIRPLPEGFKRRRA